MGRGSALALARLRRAHYAWRIVGAAFLLYTVYAGTGVYVFGFFLKPLAAAFETGRAATSAAIGVYMATTALSSPLVGRLNDRYGSRPVMTGGALLVAAALLLLSATPSLWFLYIFYALLALGSHGLGVIPVSALLIHWFAARRGLALALASMGFTAGGAVVAPLVGLAVDHWGWRAGYVLLGTLTLATALPVALTVVRTRPSDRGLAPYGAVARTYGEGSTQETIARREGTAAREPLRSSSFWWLAVAGLAGAFGMTAVLQHQVAILTDRGMSVSVAAGAVSATIGLGGVGKLLFGLVADRVKPRHAYISARLIQALGVGLLAGLSGPAGWWSYVLVFGLAMGAWDVLFPLVAAQLLGVQAFGTLVGLLMLADSVGASTGPVLAGYFYDVLGNYRLALGMVGGVLLVAAAALFLAGRRRRPQPAKEAWLPEPGTSSGGNRPEV